MSALSKAIIVDDICDNLDLSRADAKMLVDNFFEALRQGLETGHHIKLSGFGNFTLRDKVERPGRNPKTGQDIPVASRRVVTFKSGLKLKNKITSEG